MNLCKFLLPLHRNVCTIIDGMLDPLSACMVLRVFGVTAPYPRKYLYHAVNSGNIELIKYVMAMSDYDRLCNVIAKTGDYEIYRWARIQDFPSTVKICYYAAKYNRLEFLERTYRNFKLRECIPHVQRGAVAGGHIAIMEWIHSITIVNIDDDSYTNAASYRNHFKLTKWLCEHGYELAWDMTTYFAANSNLEAVKWSNDYMPACGETLDAAIEAGSVEIVDWLLSINCSSNTYIVADALAYGKLEIVKHLHSTGYYFEPDVIRYASSIECIEWLLSQGFEITQGTLSYILIHCSSTVLDYLHAHGYLVHFKQECVDRLKREAETCRTVCHNMHHNTHCTTHHTTHHTACYRNLVLPVDTNLINLVALKPHVDKIKWAVQNGFCITLANVQIAIDRRDLKVLSVYVECGYEPTEDIFMYAVQSRYIPIIEFLYLRNCPFTSRAFDMICQDSVLYDWYCKCTGDKRS